MSQVTGIIEQKSQREANTKFGPKQSYSIKINGEWYSAGFKPCPYEEGQTVCVDYTMNGAYKNISGYGAAPAGAAPTPTSSGAAPAASGGYARAPAKEFPLQADHPDRVIVRQNSLAHATALYTSQPLAEGEVLALDEAAEAIIKLAYKFEAYSTGERETEAAKGLMDDGFPV